MPDLLFLLSWTPILLIFVLAVFLRMSALPLAAWGFAYTVLLAATVFTTDAGVMFLAALDGMATTTPLILVVYFGILLSSYLMEKGSLQRLAAWLAVDGLGQVKKTLLLSFGIGNFLEGAGIIAEPVAAPMLVAAGVRPTAATALGLFGYSGIMHLSLAGVIVTVLTLVTGIPAQTLAWDLGLLSFAASVPLALAVPWMMGLPLFGHGVWRKDAVAIVGTGCICAGVAWAAAVGLGYTLAGMVAGAAVIAFFYGLARRVPAWDPARRKEVLRDLAPFLLVFVCLAVVNFVPPVHHLAKEGWVLKLDFIPGHTVKLRPFFDAYTYLGLAFILAHRMHRNGDEGFAKLLWRSTRRASRTILAMALFGAMGQILSYTGYGAGFENFAPERNVALCLANGLIDSTGALYPLFAPFLGWVGTFLTGYGVASIMLFGKLQLEAAALLGVSPSLLASSLAVGASIGSISSPFKIALGSPLCGVEGREGEILRRTIPLGIGISFVAGVATLLL